MANDTLTLALNGEVSLQEFAEAMQYFNALVKGLTIEIAREASIEWVIDTLESGSTIATVKGETDRMDSLAAVVSAYSTVGRVLHAHQTIPYSDRVRTPAQRLIGLLDSRITSIRFETESDEYLVEPYVEGKPELKPTYAYGRLKGTVQTLSARRGIKFVLYDVLFDRPVSCYLREGQEELIRPYWDKKVFVSGKIGRDPETGKPFVMREITEIEPVESKPGGFRRASGMIELRPNETSESVIRTIRNG